MPTIQNDAIIVDISAKGAELQSIYNKQTQLEYMWSADEIWPKKSPVLFPIVGELKNNTYLYGGKSYQLGRHGFAREKEFIITEHNESSVTFTIHDTAETLEIYPFAFNFSVQYTIDNNRLYVVYTVKNKDDKDLLFSVGGHPAFKLPLDERTEFEDYYLSFAQVENAGVYPLSAEGLIELNPVSFFNDAERLPLRRSLFYNDALVFKEFQSASIDIKNDKTTNGIRVFFEQFPYLGIWNKKDADFICIEPWCGIADSVNATGYLEEKEGINILKPGATFERQWSVEVY